jgi:anti-sigma factor RsiW
MKDCVRYAPMIGSRPGELAPEEVRGLAVHLAGCEACRRLDAEVRAQDGLVAQALLAEASRRDFAPFVDGVMARVEARRARGPLAAFRAIVAAHRRLAAALAAAIPVVAAVAVVVYVRSERTPADRLALLELDSVGEVSMVLRTDDGPLVLLADGPEGS